MTREMIKQIERDYWAEKAEPIDMAEVFDLAQRALEQEPKPMVEIDLDYVIKQKYIEREVLDKIRAEIGKSKTDHEMQIAEKDIKAKLLISDIYCDIVTILNKYKAESEET